MIQKHNNLAKIVLLITISILSYLVHSRIYTNSYTMVYLRRQRGWIFMDRMTFAKGSAKIQFKSKLQIKDPKPEKQYQIQLIAIPDRLWDKQTIIQCNKNSLSQSQIKQKQSLQKSLVTQMNVANGMENTQQLNFDIQQQQLTYHFVLRDCQKNLVNQYFSKDSKIQIQIYMLNNGKHHGQQQSSNSFTLPILVGLSLLMIKLTKGLKSSLDNQWDYPKILLNVGLWVNLAALMCKFLSHFIYIYLTGKQYPVFDFIYLLMHSISQSLITCLLILLAYGWTVTFVSSRDFDLYIPLLSMLGLINVILTMLGKINDNDHNKYHMYDSIPSYILVFFRIVAVIAFFIGIIYTLCYNKKDKKIMQFYKKFGIMGGLYFFSLPILILISKLIQETEREQFVFLFVQFIKNGVNFILTYMIASKRSQYKQVKLTNRSFMQMDGNKYK